MRSVMQALLLFSLLFVGCSHATGPEGNPDWVNGLIATFASQPVGNPPQSIWRYEYNGETVYYVPAQCCDQYSTLFNSQGVRLCAPDGGFTGRGDGKCPDFFAKRAKEKLIWKDPRSSSGTP